MKEQWISIKEQLPEKDGKYLVHVPTMDKSKPFFGVVWYSLDSGWKLRPDPFFLKAITHWMALPGAPIEKD